MSKWRVINAIVSRLSVVMHNLSAHTLYIIYMYGVWHLFWSLSYRLHSASL